MKKNNSQRNSRIGILIFIVALIILGGLAYQHFQHNSNGTAISSVTPTGEEIQYGTLKDKVPSQTLAESVLVDSVKQELGNNIKWNGAGAFYINDNQSTLNADVSSAPYATNTPLNAHRQLGVANALLNKSTRQQQNRNATSGENGKSNSATIKPAGWIQKDFKGGAYSTLYNRGHLIGYALVGGLRGFDASEANPDNIATQTAWANQASNGNSENTGQNYYETLVRKAIDNGATVRYQVKPIYVGNELVPRGNQIQAKSKDGSLNFNVFIPNVQAGIGIDYQTGKSQEK
ncbi:MAG: DNA/RNA non-specific endonuclease [Streptococcaceae bacterium]|nr:DNA/RNA non-specific endonuclease [Streptococcaceae bacterium]